MRCATPQRIPLSTLLSQLILKAAFTLEAVHAYAEHEVSQTNLANENRIKENHGEVSISNQRPRDSQWQGLMSIVN